MGRKLTTDQKNRVDAAMLVAYGDVDSGLVPCSWCGIDLDVFAAYGDYERDRVRPGDDYSYTNVLPSCRGCNNDRQDATDGEWQEAHRLYSVADGIGCPATATWKSVRDRKRHRIGADAADRAARRAQVRQERA